MVHEKKEDKVFMFGLGDEDWRRGWVQGKEAFTLPASRPRSVYTSCRRLRVTTALSVNPVTGSEKDNVFLWTNLPSPSLFAPGTKLVNHVGNQNYIFNSFVCRPTSSDFFLPLPLSPSLSPPTSSSQSLPSTPFQKTTEEEVGEAGAQQERQPRSRGYARQGEGQGCCHRRRG